MFCEQGVMAKAIGFTQIPDRMVGMGGYPRALVFHFRWVTSGEIESITAGNP